MQKFTLEFILHVHDAVLEPIKSALAEFGEDIEIVEAPDTGASGKDFKIKISAEDPTMIFDVCGQFGRIKTIKVSEIK